VAPTTSPKKSDRLGSSFPRPCPSHTNRTSYFPTRGRGDAALRRACIVDAGMCRRRAAAGNAPSETWLRSGDSSAASTAARVASRASSCFSRRQTSSRKWRRRVAYGCHVASGRGTWPHSSTRIPRRMTYRRMLVDRAEPSTQYLQHNAND